MACVTLDDIRLLNQVMQYRSLVYWRDLNKIAQVQIHNWYFVGSFNVMKI